MKIVGYELQHEIIIESEKALLVKGLAGGYETWIKVRSSRTGRLYIPTDEDFGTWCWSHYTLTRARQVFREINSGIGTIRVWQEAPQVAREPILNP